MTRKDYVAIAAAIKAARVFHLQQHSQCLEFGQIEASHFQDGAQCGNANTAREIADVMAKDNPRFDRERFLKACGVQS